MKYLLFATVLIFTAGTPASAQSGGLGNRIHNKVVIKATQRVYQKADKQIDETLDALEGKKQPANSNTNSATSTTVDTKSSGNKDARVTSYSKFDFIAGENIIYADDFSEDEKGQLPLHWNTEGKAELVTIDKINGNWLRLFPTAVYLPGNKQSFTKNFTVEFDLLLDMKNTGYSYPYFSFGLLSSGDSDPSDNEFLKSYRQIQSAEVYVRLSSGGSTSTYMESFDAGRKGFQSETQPLSNLENFYGKSTHICIQVQESRFRVWFNGDKKFDIPRALSTSSIFNNIFFRTFSSSYKEDELGFYISNIKVATGFADTRHKLVDEGKFSTTGIMFDVNTASIKPESNGVLQELSGILQKNPDIKIKIVGHTDSDGKDAENLELSKKRAAAVKEIIIRDFGIDASRMETDGKGETEPAQDNKSKEGKARNRRVDFIKK